MYFEVVTKTTPVEGLHYHARIRTNEHDVLFRSANYTSKAEALRACEIVKAGTQTAELYETVE
jgi:uncharacterized protein YegP (UPF0339 family)